MAVTETLHYITARATGNRYTMESGMRRQQGLTNKCSLAWKLPAIFGAKVAQEDSGVFRRIPLEAAGRLYTSPMPFGAYDKGNRLLRLYKQYRIDHVLILATDEEMKRKTRRNLPALYDKAGIGHSRYAIVDFQSPSMQMLYDMVAEGVNRLNRQRLAVHCHAGVGRTAVAVCGIVMAQTLRTAIQAMAYVQQHMTVNMTSEQKRLVERFQFDALM